MRSIDVSYMDHQRSGGGWKPQAIINHERMTTPQPAAAYACPRCGSANTKFCYYNNYSLTQPRYFCKGCRRYWTKGGSLRNVPIGGGCRRTRRGVTTTTTTTTTTSAINHHKATAASFPNALRGGGHVSLGRSSSSTNINDPFILSDQSSASSSSCTLGIRARRHDSGSGSGPNNNIDLALVYANFLNQKPAAVLRPPEVHVDDQEVRQQKAARESQEISRHDHHGLKFPILMPPADTTNIMINNAATVDGGTAGNTSSFPGHELQNMLDLMGNNNIQLSQGLLMQLGTGGSTNLAGDQCAGGDSLSTDPSSDNTPHFSAAAAADELNYFSGFDLIDQKQQQPADYQRINASTANTTTTRTALNPINNYVMFPPLPGHDDEELITSSNTAHDDSNQRNAWSGGCYDHDQELLLPCCTPNLRDASLHQSSSGLVLDSQAHVQAGHPNDILDGNRGQFNLPIDFCSIFRP